MSNKLLDITGLPSELHLPFLRVLVGTKNEPLLDHLEKDFLEGLQQHFFETSFNLQEITPLKDISVIQEIFKEHIYRKQLVKFAIIFSLCEGSVDPKKLEFLKKLDSMLETKERGIKFLRYALKNEIIKLRILLRFYSFGHENFRNLKAIKALYLILKSEIRIWRGFTEHFQPDKKLLEKSKKLKDYPLGSVGRVYLGYLHANKLNLPGEEKGAAKFIIPHDMSHILGEYDTTPNEEITVLFFVAGYRTIDVLPLILFALFHFHLGIPVGLLTPHTNNRFEPFIALHALKRGSGMKIDLENKWNPWSIMSENIQKVRKKYNILPRKY